MSIKEFTHHSWYEGSRWSELELPTVEGKLLVAVKAYYSRPIWGGPLLPIIPVGLFAAEDPMGCAPRTVAIIKYGVAAQDSIEVDWGDIVVVANGEPILDSLPDTWHFLQLTRQGGDWHTQKYDLVHQQNELPVLTVQLPPLRIGEQWIEFDPFTLEIEEGRYFGFGFK